MSYNKNSTNSNTVDRDDRTTVNALKIADGLTIDTTPTSSELGLAMHYAIHNDFLDISGDGIVSGIEKLINESKSAKVAARVIYDAIISMNSQNIN